MSLGLHANGMHDWLMDELELGARVAHFLDGENHGFRLGYLSLEFDHWNCPTDDAEHERLHSNG
jgi:hypothetical protein